MNGDSNLSRTVCVHLNKEDSQGTMTLTDISEETTKNEGSSMHDGSCIYMIHLAYLNSTSLDSKLSLSLQVLALLQQYRNNPLQYFGNNTGIGHIDIRLDVHTGQVHCLVFLGSVNHRLFPFPLFVNSTWTCSQFMPLSCSASTRSLTSTTLSSPT